MARKDVDLVIRAKDEAANVVKHITDALNVFINAQSRLQDKAGGTEGALAGLGAAVGQLESALKGLGSGASFAQDMTKAEDAVGRLELGVEASQGEFAQLEQRVRNAEAATVRYQQKLDGAVAAQQRQTQVFAKARQESKELTDAYDLSVSAVDRLTTRFGKLPNEVGKTYDAFAKASARVADLREQLEATEEPSRSLVNQLAAAERNLSKQADKLDRLRAEYVAVESEMRAAGSAMAIFSGQSAEAAQSLARQESILGKIKANVSDLGTRSKSAASDQNRLENSLDKTSGALAREIAQLERAKGKYVELAEASSRFNSTLGEATRSSRGNLDQQLVDQGTSVRTAREEFARLEHVAHGYASTMLAAGPPTREVSQRIQFLAQRADEAQYKLLAQEEALHQMSSAYREVSSDMASVTQGQARFISTQERLTTVLREVAQDGFKQRQAIRGVHEAATTATGSVSRLSGATSRQADASRRGATETGRLADAYRRLYGDTRQSLSYTQRLRGEVLSLIAAYGGLYGVIEGLRAVTNAYQTLEAAQSRLGVAFDGNLDRTAQEMDFLRRTANRLGVDLGTLATEYSKFAIATQGTELAGAATRQIFVSVAEAARVNRSTTEEMSGVFTALTQIVSKGAVQMEELRQQLGDRLPGALQIMADGLQVSTAELIKMMEAGEVTSAALVPFSEELTKRFGPGLANALASTSVALGRLGNAAFQAMVKFGSGGFIDSLTDLANTLTRTLQSADFEAFLGRASAAVAILFDTLGVLATNFDLVVAAGSAFLALRLTPIIVALVSKLAGLPATLAASAAGLRAFATGTAAVSTGANTAAASVGRLTLAMRALMTSTGIGLLITAVSVGIGLWATRADEASEALNTHKGILDDVRNAYDAVGGSVDEWRKNLTELTETEALENVERIQKAVEAAEAGFQEVLNDRGGTFNTRFFGIETVQATRQFQEELSTLFRKYQDGEIAAEDLVDATDAITSVHREASDANARLADSAIDAAQGIADTREALDEAGKVLRARTGNVEEAQDAFDDLGNTAQDASRSLEEIADEKAAKFAAAMREMAEGIESVNRELEYMEASAALQKLGDEAIRNVANVEELVAVFERLRQAQDALDVEYGNDVAGMAQGDTGTEAAAALLRQFEGFRATPYNDPRTDSNGNQIGPNVYRSGYGSDTITLSDGTIQKVTAGMRVSVADANRDLMRRIDTEFGPIARRAAGGERFETFNPQQQAALISIAYNYGEIPDRIAAAVRDGTNQEIAAAIRSLGGDNGGINEGRRNQEAGLFVATDPNEDAARRAMAADQERADAARDLAEEEAERRETAREATQERLEDGQFEIEQQRLLNAEREREAAINAAVRDAQRENPEIGDSELAQIREQAAALHDLETAQDRANASKDRAKESEEEINFLLAQRNALEEQFNIAEETGNTELQEELRVKMAEVNAQMVEAIATARELWEAVGGAEGEAAVARLDAATASAARFGIEAQKNYLDWSRVSDLFVNGLTTAFDKIAEAWANNEDRSEAARDAFKQFASDFLREIARMIMQQALLNALRAAFGGTSFGAGIGLGSVGIGAGHTGGVVGSSRVGSGNQTRMVNPAVFAGAMRYHTGGLIGLRPGEVPIIAKQGEEMLTRDDPRHALNQGNGEAKAQPSVNRVKIVNAFDGSSFLEAALAERRGEETLLNFVSSNRSAIRSALGV